MIKKKKILASLLLFCILTIGNVECFAATPDATSLAIYQIIMDDNPGLGESVAMETAQAIATSCGNYGVDPMIATALMLTESNFSNTAYSPGVGALGIGQMMPETAEEMGYDPSAVFGYAPGAIENNVDGSVHYLQQRIADCGVYGGYAVTFAIASYNAGLGAVQKYGGIPPYTETINYVNKIAGLYAEFTGTNLDNAPTAMIPFHIGNSSLLKLDFDFAKPLRDAINTFSQQCTAGIKLVQDDVKWLFFSLIVIDLALSAMFNLFEDDWEPLSWFLKRFLKYGFILFLILHWGDMLANSLKDYFVYMGAAATGATVDFNGNLADSATIGGQALSDPTFIVQKGASIVGPAFTYINKFSLAKLIPGVGAMLNLSALLLALAILFCYFIVGYQIVLAYLEFYIIASLSVVTLGFGGLRQTKFLAEKGLGALVAVSIKLMIFSFLAIFMSETVKNIESIPFEFSNYLRILLVSMLFVLLGSRVTRTAGKFFAGASPKL